VRWADLAVAENARPDVLITLDDDIAADDAITVLLDNGYTVRRPHTGRRNAVVVVAAEW
jgi:hypothetical protein